MRKYLLLVALVAGCAAPPPEADPEPTLPTDPAALKAVTAGANDFAADFLPLAGEGNVICSPLGVSTVFGMLSHGARGSTLAQLRAALHLPDDPATAAGFASLTRQLNAAKKTAAAGFELSTANALWGQKGYPWRPEYVETLKGGYGTAVREGDFGTNADGVRREINGWVERQTRDKIKDLVAPGALDADTRLVLVNALYFKAKWEHEFKPDVTKSQPFTTATGDKVQAAMMYQKSRFALLETDDFQAIELPYKGRAASLLVFLPRKADGLPAFEKVFTAANLSKWTATPWPVEEVQTHLPKFRVETAIDLVPALQALGVKDVFDREKSDLSGMATGDRLFVGVARQKAFVDVNEEGTEAAAATFAGVKTAAAPVPRKEFVFRADHPFVFAIRHAGTGAILFVGRVTNPKGGG